ncbi:MAG: hypothetical protein U9O06_06980 [Euryarchaeota archaeon]|nr:hypothetical protein [Euryarchaeota archaeon]
MIGFPIRLQVRTWLQRISEWYSPPDSLDEVQEVTTIGDRIESQEIGSRLPDGWSVDREIVQFRGESLAEVLRLTNRSDGYRITLKPTDMTAPTGRIRIYTRPSPFKSREYRQTADSLSAAIGTATEIAASRDTRQRQSAEGPRRESAAIDRSASA